MAKLTSKEKRDGAIGCAALFVIVLIVASFCGDSEESKPSFLSRAEMNTLKLLAPIEPDARVFSGFVDTEKALNMGVTLIRLQGWRCDSISNVRELMSFSRTGFKINCNHFQYTYEIADRAGTWVACINSCKF